MASSSSTADNHNADVDAWLSWTKRKEELRASGELKKLRKWMTEEMDEEFSSSGGPYTPPTSPPAAEPEKEYSFSETQEAMFQHIAAW